MVLVMYWTTTYPGLGYNYCIHLSTHNYMHSYHIEVTCMKLDMYIMSELDWVSMLPAMHATSTSCCTSMM